MLKHQERTVEEIGQVRHERVPKPTKMSADAHFFREDVRQINFAGDVFNRKGIVEDPFTDRIFPKLNVAGGL
jgi:hypothetical protein